MKPLPWQGLACLLALSACLQAPPVAVPIGSELQTVAAELQQGNIERAEERLARLRRLAARDPAVSAWSALVAGMLWQDDVAVQHLRAAIRLAAESIADVVDANDLQARLGELLFSMGQWGESAAPLALAAQSPVGGARLQAMLAAAQQLPFLRRQVGPLLTEQPLLPGEQPEFLCGNETHQRALAIDTGTSMTTLATSLARELGVAASWPAGAALDAAGKPVPVAMAVLPELRIGGVELGAVPTLVVDDAALALRDRHGGAPRASAGVLGLDLLAAFRLTLDPERGSVVLELSRNLAVSESVQTVRVDGRCLCPVEIEGVRLWFVLDTGASHSSLSVAGLRALPGGEGRAVPSFRRVRTLAGSQPAVREVRQLVLHVSATTFRGVALPVVSRQETGPFPVHGVLGLDLLARCRLTLDRGRLRLVGSL